MEKPTAAPALCPRNSRRPREVDDFVEGSVTAACFPFILHLEQRGEYHREGLRERWPGSLGRELRSFAICFRAWVRKGPFSRPRLGVTCDSALLGGPP